MITFGVRLCHASLYGRDRRQWSMSYAGFSPAPADRARLRAYIGSFPTEGHKYDAAAYPYFDRSWLREHRRSAYTALDELVGL